MPETTVIPCDYCDRASPTNPTRGVWDGKGNDAIICNACVEDPHD